MNVVSLFDGMGCLTIALKELGITPGKYYSSEIDKFANKQTLHNFPNIIQLGDINNWREWDIDWKSIDLVGVGSPCQGFSFAGKQLAFDDPRSQLFFVFVEILNHIKKVNPDVLFLLENVRMKKEHLRIMSEYVGIFPCSINSNLVSAQNRFRYYWTNICTKEVGMFNELYTDIPQPKDLNIFLKDILQPDSEVDEKYFIKNISKYNLTNIEPGGIGVNNSIVKNRDKSGCLDAHYYKGIENNQDRTGVCVVMRGRDSACLTPKRTEYGKEIRKDYESGKIKEQRKNIQQLEPREDGKTNTISTVQKDNLIMKVGNIYPSGGENGNIYSIDGKSPTIKSGETSTKGNGGVGSCNAPKITYNYKLRRLTPIECARLQTVPEWYEWVVSDTQIYKMLGNGWTIKKIMHILSFINL